MFQSIFIATAAQAAVIAPEPLEPWPTEEPGAVISTPNWSDYRIYPKVALRRDQEGRVRAELLVSADGKPQDCRIVETSGFKELDSGTCDLMMQMRFEPARDSAGAAIASHFERRFNWRLTDPRPFASSTLKIRVVTTNGQLTGCEIIGGDGDYAAFWSQAACSYLRDVKYYFGDRAADSAQALVELRLDAGDEAPFLREPWPAGTPIAARTVSFAVNSHGDPVECVALSDHGFGPRGLNNLSPCGSFLASLWLSVPKGTARRTGHMETRVYLSGQ